MLVARQQALLQEEENWARSCTTLATWKTYLSVDLHRGHILKATWPPRALILHLFLLPFACRHTEQSNQPHTADTSVPDILPWQCNNRA